ncbi:MAG: methyltransferase domain-containing protein [Bacillota bacterium]|nr:methyltransferase domain-containing protein [Bacillota bacterium]
MNTKREFHSTGKGEVKDKYSNCAGKYDSFNAGLEFIGLRKFRKNLVRQASGKVLEVAAGTGVNFEYYRSISALTAVDLSPQMLKIALQRAGKLDLVIEVSEMDAENLEFPDQYFDTVVSCLSTCTFTDPVKALKEMNRVCRSDGRILLLEHGRSDNCWLSRIQDRTAKKWAEMVACHWNRDTMEIIRQSGLSVFEVRKHWLGIVNVIIAVPNKMN